MSKPQTIMQILAELKQKDFKDLTHAERAVIIANEAIDGLRNEIVNDKPGAFKSLEKAAKAIGVEPNSVVRVMGVNRTRRMSAWLFVRLCRACGYECVSTSTEDALKAQPNLTLEAFLIVRRIGGDLSDAIELMGRQG